MKKELRTACCASASLQRSEEIPVASEGRSEKGAVPSQDYWISQEVGDDQRQGRAKKNSAVLGT